MSEPVPMLGSGKRSPKILHFFLFKYIRNGVSFRPINNASLCINDCYNILRTYANMCEFSHEQRITANVLFYLNVSHWDPFYKHGLTLIPAWISNYIHFKCRVNLFIYSQCSTVWKWMNKFIPHFSGHVISHTCWDQSWTALVKRAAGGHWWCN